MNAQARGVLLELNLQHLTAIEIEQNLSICLREYDHLLNHDPTNEKWRARYKRLIHFLDRNRDIVNLAKIHDAEIDSRLRNLQSF